MKRVLCLIMIISNFGARGSYCNGSGENANRSFTMVAEVRDTGEKIEVEVLKSQYAAGTYLVITSDKTEFSSKEEGEISRSDIHIGDTVEIVYGGEVMLSYPPQIVAIKIKKLR